MTLTLMDISLSVEDLTKNKQKKKSQEKGYFLDNTHWSHIKQTFIKYPFYQNHSSNC